MIYCLQCDTVKEDEAFPISKKQNKRYSPCQSCRNLGASRWRARNPERNKAAMSAWYAANRERQLVKNAEHRAANREKLNEASRLWWHRTKEARRETIKEQRIRNAGAIRYSKIRRVKKVKQATPSWANNAVIDLYYRIAHEIEKQTGFAVHVDHIIPLTHKDVCGLHYEGNLQLMWAEDNISKFNKIVDAPIGSTVIRHAFTPRDFGAAP